jgi:histone H3/H4
MKEQVENFDRIIRQLQDEVTSKSSIVEELTTKVSSLQNLILEQADK